LPIVDLSASRRNLSSTTRTNSPFFTLRSFVPTCLCRTTPYLIILWCTFARSSSPILATSSGEWPVRSCCYLLYLLTNVKTKSFIRLVPYFVRKTVAASRMLRLNRSICFSGVLGGVLSCLIPKPLTYVVKSSLYSTPRSVYMRFGRIPSGIASRHFFNAFFVFTWSWARSQTAYDHLVN
jgi:hypothetical protein